MMELTKENWASLTDDEKTVELQQIIPGADYKKYKEIYEKYYNDTQAGSYMVYEHPCLTLKLIDPVMTFMLGQWMYRKGNKMDCIPIFGYKLEKVTFDEKTLMNFSDSETEILKEAIKIISNKLI